MHGSPRFAAHLRSIGLDAEHLESLETRKGERKASRRSADPEQQPGAQLTLALS